MIKLHIPVVDKSAVVAFCTFPLLEEFARDHLVRPLTTVIVSFATLMFFERTTAAVVVVVVVVVIVVVTVIARPLCSTIGVFVVLILLWLLVVCKGLLWLE